MADVAPSLDQLRAEIDRIDDDLVRLLGQRVEIGRRVAAAKGDSSGPFLRPGREAAILRRLVDQGLGQVPPMVIERIWREILAANLARQVDPVTAVWDPSGGGSVLEQARDRGGISTRVELVSSAEAALDAVTAGRATLAVLPALRTTEWRWWPLLLADRTPKPRVIARLPFFGAGEDSVGVAAQDPDASGDDISYFAAPGELRGALDTATGPDGEVWSLLSVDGFVATGGAHHGHIPAGAYPIGAHARPYSP
jgi:chorismate mutase